MIKFSIVASLLAVTLKGVVGDGHHDWTGLINSDGDCPFNTCVTNLRFPWDGPGSSELFMLPCGRVNTGSDVNLNNQKWMIKDARPENDFAGLLSDGLPVYQIVSKRTGECVGVTDCYSGELVMEDCEGSKEAFTYWLGFTGGLPSFISGGGEINLGCWAGFGDYVPLHVHCGGYYSSLRVASIPEVIVDLVRNPGPLVPAP